MLMWLFECQQARELLRGVVKAALNPFFSDAVPVAAPGFDRRVRSLARSYFRTVG